MIQFFKKKENIRRLFIAVIAILVAYAPYFRSGLPTGGDDTFHLYRIYSIADALKNGIFPVKISFLKCYGYGYGEGLFYPNLLFYFPALLVMLGMPLFKAYKVFVFCLMTAIFGTTSYSAFRICKNADAALIAGAIGLFSDNLLTAFYVYVRLGTVTGLLFTPLAIAGIYLLVTGEDSKYMTVIGFAGLLYSHTISTLLAVCICAGICLFHAKRIFTDKKVFQRLIFSVGIVSLIAAPYWLSMLEQMHSQLFKVKAPFAISEQNVKGLHDLTATGGIGGIALAILIIYVVVVLLFAFIQRRNLVREQRGAAEFFVISVILTLLPLWYPFWHFMNTTLGIRAIQFPERLWGPAGVLIAFIAAMMTAVIFTRSTSSNDAHGSRIAALVCSLLALIVVGIGAKEAYDNCSERYLVTDSTVDEEIMNGEIEGIGAGEEWLPIMTTRDYMQEPETARSDSGEAVIGEKRKGNSVFVFEAEPGNEWYDVPYIYYKGYRAYLENGERLNIEHNKETGMIRVLMPEDLQETMTVTVSYFATKYQKVSYAFLLIGCGMLAAQLLWERNRRNAGNVEGSRA